MALRETSTTYQWPAGDGLIDHIEIVRSKNGSAVAYLHAKEDPALKPQRLEVRQKIRAHGWGTLSDHRDGKFVLRVSGIRNSDAFITMVTEAGYIKGPAAITSHAAEKEAPEGFLDSIRGNSLRYSGIIATIGNALGIASGFARGKEIGQIGKSTAFAIADLPLALAGSRDDRRQLNNLLRRLKAHYDQNGIPIPKTAAILVETSDKEKGFGELLGDYMHRYANQIKCSLEVVAAFFSWFAGGNQKNPYKKYSPFFWGTGFFLSGIIPEKKLDEEKYATAGMLERAWMKIQSNPLALGGMLGWTNNAADFIGAQRERKAFIAGGSVGKRNYRWDFAIPSVMIGANGLYAISKKTTGGDIRTTAMERDVYSIASQIINKLPDEQKEAAIESTARFLGTRTEIRGGYREILEELKKTVAIQRQNPWFEPPRTQATALAEKQAPASITTEKSVATETPIATVNTVTREQPSLATNAEHVSAAALA